MLRHRRPVEPGAVRELSAQVLAPEGPLEHPLVVAGPLLEAGRNPPTLLQASRTPFDVVAMICSNGLSVSSERRRALLRQGINESEPHSPDGSFLKNECLAIRV